MQTEIGPFQYRKKREEDSKRKHDDPQAVPGDGHATQFESARHPCWIANLAVCRPEHGSHRLLQDQGNAPGRQQCFKRATIEKPDDAAFDHQTDQRRKEEGQWQGDGKRPVEQPRIIGADHLLHHESDIGAQHDHFAMRHVDDAHDAKGNSKADGRKQQDGTERKTVPDILSGIPESLPLLDMSDGAVECLGKFRLRIGARRIQDRQCGTVAIILQELRRLELVIERVVGGQKCRSLRLLQK